MSFRSSVVLDQLCVHECTVIGRGGRFWPAPTFKVTAMDRADEPLIAKSCTGCWSAVRVSQKESQLAKAIPHSVRYQKEFIVHAFPCTDKHRLLYL